MVYLVDDVWGIVKEFMLDWRRSWYKNMKFILDGITCHYPKTLVGERYSMKTRLYHTTFMVPYSFGYLETRVSNHYDIKENQWIGTYSL